jgi:hypothetical protein
VRRQIRGSEGRPARAMDDYVMRKVRSGS